MMRSTSVTTGVFAIVLCAGAAFGLSSTRENRMSEPRYLRVSTARWDINLYTPEAERIFKQIETEGVAVFRAQPGFIRYRLMRTDSSTTIAVAEWESERLGKVGAEQYRAWMGKVGIMAHLTLETRAGEIVAKS